MPMSRPELSKGDHLRVGLVSDTHGLFEPRLEELFRDCDLILHAGDVVKPEVLSALSRLAPVRAVRGNADEGTPLESLPVMAELELGPLRGLLVHEIGSPGKLAAPLRRELSRRPVKLVVHGHSHRPGVTFLDGRWFVNPGSAGPRRFSLPRAAGVLEVMEEGALVRLLDLEDPALRLLASPVLVCA
jgi:uncharacterized protein